jgi:hypothetical protein
VSGTGVVTTYLAARLFSWYSSLLGFARCEWEGKILEAARPNVEIGQTYYYLFTCVCAFPQSGFNFNVGGGPGFQVGQISNFANTAGNFVVGGGPNLGRILGVDGEFMYYSLPVKQNVLAVTGAPSGSSRMYSVTANAMSACTRNWRRGLVSPILGTHCACAGSKHGLWTGFLLLGSDVRQRIGPCECCT